MKYRLGIDVGGTNTDAVIIDEFLNIISGVKMPTTLDVTTGINNAIKKVLEISKVDKKTIEYAMLGTTHCTNAIVERKGLCRVGVVRIAAPATLSISPMPDWPADLKTAIGDQTYIIKGGYEFDGREITSLDYEEIRSVAKKMKGNVDTVAVTAVFSPVRNEHEYEVERILREELGDIPISKSNEIATVGLLERENATILNAALYHVASRTVKGFQEGLKEEGIDQAKLYLCQNDGTLMSSEYAQQYPILTIACGPTNSIRGASYLSQNDNAIVLDVGGTTTDIGVIMNGFPRESSLAVTIGGARTNFRMPDVTAIGVGGGTIVRQAGDKIIVGPDSVGYQITEKALIFGGDTLTTSDIAVRLGMLKLGDPAKVAHLDEKFAKEALTEWMRLINEGVDRMKISAEAVPVILVGGGSVLVTNDLEGVSEIIRPDHFPVANAVGSAISQVSGEINRVFSLVEISRDEALDQAKNTAVDEALKAGADPDSIEILEVEDIPLAYHPGNATRIRVKAVGDLCQEQTS
jgi:N-methylhydantoinase A/oxoprolinase/acetone carboxylase beta subunit